MTSRLSFGPVRTSAAPTPERTRPLRLSAFGEFLLAGLLGAALVGLPWLAVILK